MNKAVLTFVLFVFLTGGMVSIYEISQNQPLVYNPVNNFQQANNNIKGNFTNPTINQGSASVVTPGSTSNNSTQSGQCPNLPFLPITNPICQIEQVLVPALASLECSLGNTAVCNVQPNVAGINAGATLSGQLSQTSASNFVAGILANPIAQTITVAGIFLALGWLAGIFGAGINAPTVAKVAIAISLVYYMNAQMSVFGINVFTVFTNANIAEMAIFSIVNLITGVGVILLVWDSLGGGKTS